MSIQLLEEIFHPQSIAVAGASDNPDAMGYSFTRHLIDYGYHGRIYPVNPKYQDILGMKAYPSLKEIPDQVDYVISCVPAPGVLGLLSEGAQKGVKAVHLFTGRFSETGRQDAADLEQEVLKQARTLGIRIIGPNCMGLYVPGVGTSFGYDFPKESGTVGVISQTGGGATYLIHSIAMRGLHVSKAISYGNGLDLNECDFLDYFADDGETGIVLVYLEGIKDGKRFFPSLRRAASTKPVVVVKGGRGKSGMRAAASHTAALAAPFKILESAITQAGAVTARNFDEMADLAVSFHCLPALAGPRVGIIGVGGGPSVLAADECEDDGLDVVPLPSDIRDRLRNRSIPIWDWVGNPVDVSILGGFIGGTEILQMMAGSPGLDMLLGLINEDAPFGKEGMTARLRNDIDGYVRVKKETSKPLMVVVGERGPTLEEHDNWRRVMLSEARTKLIAAGIPVYPTVSRAARAARRLVDYYERRAA